jgi:hypothetical protein
LGGGEGSDRLRPESRKTGPSKGACLGGAITEVKDPIMHLKRSYLGGGVQLLTLTFSIFCRRRGGISGSRRLEESTIVSGARGTS